jgi:ribosomal protein L35AE/L33A
VQFEKVLAGQLTGRKVLWKQGKCELVGKVLGLHGRNGVVRVRFKHGVPGQAIGATVKLLA